MNYILDLWKSPMVIPKTTQWTKSLAPLCLKKNTADYTNYLLHPLITILLRLHPKCLMSPDAVWELIDSPCYLPTPPTLTPSDHSVFNLSSPSSSQLYHQATFTMRPLNQQTLSRFFIFSQHPSFVPYPTGFLSYLKIILPPFRPINPSKQKINIPILQP